MFAFHHSLLQQRIHLCVLQACMHSDVCFDMIETELYHEICKQKTLADLPRHHVPIFWSKCTNNQIVTSNNCKRSLE